MGAYEWHRAGQEMVANGEGVLALQGSVELDCVLAGLLVVWTCERVRVVREDVGSREGRIGRIRWVGPSRSLTNRDTL